jgi:hypothetical protein
LGEALTRLQPNHETGPEFTYYETYIGGLARSELPLARDTRRDFNEYRLGSELDFVGFRLAVTHRWEYYKDDSSVASYFPSQNRPPNTTPNEK